MFTKIEKICNRHFHTVNQGSNFGLLCFFQGFARDGTGQSRDFFVPVPQVPRDSPTKICPADFCPGPDCHVALSPGPDHGDLRDGTRISILSRDNRLSLLFPHIGRRLLDHESFKNLEFFPQVGNHRLFRPRK